MRTIWRADLKCAEEMTVEVPKGSLFLDVQMHGGRPVLWFEVESDLPKETRILYLTGTGGPMPDTPLSYIGTFQTGDGSLVFHLYENLSRFTTRPKKGSDGDWTNKKLGPGDGDKDKGNEKQPA